MTTKEWLSRAYNLRKEIRQLEALSERMLDDLTSCTAPTDAERVDGGKALSEDTRIKRIDLINKIELQKNRLENIVNEIEDAIEKVPDVTSRMILRARYIDNKYWFQIAQLVNYSERHVKGNLHKKALNLIKFNTKK